MYRIMITTVILGAFYISIHIYGDLLFRGAARLEEAWSRTPGERPEKALLLVYAPRAVPKVTP